MSTVVVINGNKKEFVGRFDGRDYYFPVGQQVEVSDKVAAHVFGFGQSDKTSIVVRHGKHIEQGSLEAGLAWLDNIRIVDPTQLAVEHEERNVSKRRLNRLDRADAIEV